MRLHASVVARTDPSTLDLFLRVGWRPLRLRVTSSVAV